MRMRLTQIRCRFRGGLVNAERTLYLSRVPCIGERIAESGLHYIVTMVVHFDSGYVESDTSAYIEAEYIPPERV